MVLCTLLKLSIILFRDETVFTCLNRSVSILDLTPSNLHLKLSSALFLSSVSIFYLLQSLSNEKKMCANFRASNSLRPGGMPIFVFMEQGFVAIGIQYAFHYIHGQYRIYMYTPYVLTCDARTSTFHPGNKQGAPFACVVWQYCVISQTG